MVLLGLHLGIIIFELFEQKVKQQKSIYNRWFVLKWLLKTITKYFHTNCYYNLKTAYINIVKQFHVFIV